MQINQDSTAFHEAHCVNWEIQLAMAKDDWARGLRSVWGMLFGGEELLVREVKWFWLLFDAVAERFNRILMKNSDNLAQFHKIPSEAAQFSAHHVIWFSELSKTSFLYVNINHDFFNIINQQIEKHHPSASISISKRSEIAKLSIKAFHISPWNFSSYLDCVRTLSSRFPTVTTAHRTSTNWQFHAIMRLIKLTRATLFTHLRMSCMSNLVSEGKNSFAD
jgi:hypothetical protein